MKWSIYNIIYEKDENTFILYNYVEDAIIFILRELKEIVDAYKQNIDDLFIIHPDFYNELIRKGFILDDKTNEIDNVIDKINNKLDNNEILKVTINPTLDCNLKCWYCYETHIPNSMLAPQIIENIKKFISSNLNDDRINKVELSFFGGEPLFKTKKSVLSIISFVKELCEQKGKILTVHFTTNAMLLNNKLIEELVGLTPNISIQVPFDGGKDEHDTIKKTSNSRGSYDIILKNVIQALNYGIRINIRCNYTSDNILSFKNLIDDLDEYASEFKNLISIAMQQIWQTSFDRDSYNKLMYINTLLIDRRFNNNMTGLGAVSSHCYADYKNSFVINYNGDIFKCTARDFMSRNRMGTLKCDGTVNYEAEYLKWIDSRFNSECRNCIILPICTICSQKKYENLTKDSCPNKISEKDKRNQIIHRLKSLIYEYV